MHISVRDSKELVPAIRVVQLPGERHEDEFVQVAPHVNESGGRDSCDSLAEGIGRSEV